ncbi:MAG TPA: TPM domain-containing protein, partial [Thermodesulfovibrionales bacterium]|nr:TPM domain-containing protein [Thermodesulfovibrionales bacterium]
MHDERSAIHHSQTMFVACILYLASCIFLICSPVYALDVPKLEGYVNDYAGMISPPTRGELERELKTFEKTDSTQIVILTVPSLEGESVEGFGIKVGESWKIGQKGKDNGAIFIVAKQERKLRVEVGRGLEGRLTDLMAGRIIDLVVKPSFKRGDYDGGFKAGIS